MEKSLLIGEEKMAYDTPLDARIHSVQLPPEGRLETERDTASVYARFADVFKDYEEATYFSMLPLDVAARETVLKRALEIKQETKQKEAEWASSVSTV